MKNKKDLILAIKEYANREKNWDGYDGIAPTPLAIEEAIYFLDLMNIEQKLPEVCAAGDGEICFFWKNEKLYLELGFYGKDYYSYIFISENPDVLIDDISLKSDKIPSKLITYIDLF